MYFFNQGGRVSFSYYLSIDKLPDCHANTACCFIVTDVFIIVWKETLNHVVFINFIESINLHAPGIFKSNASFKVISKTAKKRVLLIRKKYFKDLIQFAQKQGDDILISGAFNKNQALKIFEKSECCAHIK